MEETKAPVTVLTGAGGGIGHAVALRLGAAGHRVALLDRAFSKNASFPDIEVLSLECDVRSETSLMKAKSAIEKSWGQPHNLINAAAIYPRASALEMPLEMWWDVLSVNLTGTFLACRTFAPGMLSQGGGSIVNFASERALLGGSRGSHYAASKGGVVSLSRSLALEWAPTIRVNVVVPGLTDTSMPRRGLSEDVIAARVQNIPLRRIGTPEDVAGTVAFLLSDAASYITGQMICVNGGALMR